jgi:hypothetical protein
LNHSPVFIAGLVFSTETAFIFASTPLSVYPHFVLLPTTNPLTFDLLLLNLKV